MNFWDYLDTEGSVDLQGLAPALVGRFSELLARGHSVADLIGHYADEFGHLPSQKLVSLSRAHRGWQAWRRRARQLSETREKAKLPALPAEALTSAASPDELDALYRTARLCAAGDYAQPAEWTAALKGGLELWRRCLALARKDGKVRCTARDPAAAGTFEEYVREQQTLDKLAPHRWLAMRRGQRESILQLAIELPTEALLEQVEITRPRLGAPAAERSAESLLDELVGDDLQSWLVRLLDRDTEAKAIDAASASLAGLLDSQPVHARSVGALQIGRPKTSVAAIVANREGDLIAHLILKPDASWLQRAITLFGEHEIDQVVLPTSAPASELLAEAETGLAAAGMQVFKIRSAALAEARRPLTDPPLRLSVSVASALVLARRALDPLKEWGAIDPVGIGVAEYQHDLDSDRLRAALRQTVELCRLDRRRAKSSAMGATVPRGGAAIARLNPLVKTIADLRGGMAVHGVVTNISHFGAFVNIGLQQEGLVHISELSDEYVNDPNEVVSIGQQVNAYVLQVDAGRGRISLSLKRPRGTSDHDGSRAKPRVVVPRTKAEALASLERLFKK